MKNCAIIIPALNPANSLIDYVNTLVSRGTSQIIVVNDGSKAECSYIFDQLNEIKGCTVITHEMNKGKGRALKTAFTYFLKHYNHLEGVVTADADGQHSIEDVCAVADSLVNNSKGIILGVRDFSDANVPIRSYIGNKTTTLIFQLLYGSKLKDTQTGLRGIPKKELSRILELKGEHYEYEINMLIFAIKKNVTISQIPIQTIYFNNNAGSHYKSIIDSIKVFIKLISGLLYYSFSTITSGVIDILSFILLTSFILVSLPLNVSIFYGTLIARILSSSSNFYLNRKLVFKGESGNSFRQSIIKYYILCVGLLLASYILVLSSNLFFNVNVVLAKICIDTFLGIVSYQLQLYWVFKKTKKDILMEKKNAG